MRYKIKTIVSSNVESADDVLALQPGELPRDYDDEAFLNNRIYSKIFWRKAGGIVR